MNVHSWNEKLWAGAAGEKGSSPFQNLKSTVADVKEPLRTAGKGDLGDLSGGGSEAS